MENFEKWLIELPLQTLTDELKEDILSLVRDAIELEKTKAKVELLKEITKKYE